MTLENDFARAHRFFILAKPKALEELQVWNAMQDPPPVLPELLSANEPPFVGKSFGTYLEDWDSEQICYIQRAEPFFLRVLALGGVIQAHLYPGYCVIRSKDGFKKYTGKKYRTDLAKEIK